MFRIKINSWFWFVKDELRKISRENIIQYVRSNYKYYFKLSFIILLINLFLKAKILSILFYVLTTCFTFVEALILLMALAYGTKNYLNFKSRRE